MVESEDLSSEVLATVGGEDNNAEAAAAISGLVWLLGSPSIADAAKASAAGAFAALAADSRENKDRIANTPGAIEVLIRCSLQGGDKTKASAALALANLAEDHAENKLLLATTPSILPALHALLLIGSEKARWHAARLVGSLATLPQLRAPIAAEGSILDELVRLCRQGAEDSATSAACALANLTDNTDVNLERVATAHKCIPTLVNVAGGSSPEARAHAVRALANIAVSMESKTRIAKTPRAIAVLVQALDQEHGAIQSNAAAALGNLAHHNAGNKELLARSPKALGALLAALRRGSDDCRRNAGAALANICFNHEGNKMAIALHEDAVETLVWCLLETRDDCRNNAACCLANLATASRNIQARIAACENAIVGLVECARTGGADTVSNATAALANLAERNDGNKSIIGGTPRCIATLFRVAATGEQAAGVCNATCALANLAADHRPNKRAISATPGAFQIMVQLVASSNVETQSNAACALANMTADEHDAKCALAEVPFAFGALVNLARDASQPAQCNACRAIANSVSLHEDNQHAVAGVRGVFPALVALAATEEEMGQIHTVAALALANLTDANADNCRSVCVEPGALDALVRISTLAGEEGRRHAIRALANLSEFYDNRAAIVATHAAVPCLLQGSVDSSDAIATTAAFCLAKLSDHTDKLILHIADTPACFERLSECVSRGSYRAISNAAVCFCHLSAKRHSVSVRIAETKGAIRALAEAATAPLPVDGVEIDDDDDGGEAGEQKRLQRAVAEYVVASREEKPTTQDVEAAEDARRSTSFAIASVASNKGPAGHAIRALPKIRGVLKALVWVLSSPTASPDMLLPSSLPTETAPGMEERSAGDGARVLPRANAAAALANMADGDSGNVVAIVQTAGSLEGLVAAAAQRDWEHLRLHAARALANLCFFFSARTRVAATPGAIPALVAMLSSKAGACKVHAARALANLTTNHNGNRKAVVADPDAVAALVKLAIHGSAEARAHSARALGNMADTGPDASTIIGQAKNALEAAILLLTNGLAQMSEEKYRWDGKTRGPSKTADGESGRDNHENDRDEHDVEPFMLVDGCYLISALAVTDQVREAIAARPGAIDLLIKAANCGMAEARTNAVKALAGLACNNERVSNLICSHEASISTMISICLEQGKEEGVDEVSAAAIRVLVNIVDATLLGRQVMCDKDKALLSVVNMVALGTPAAKGNACYLLANLLELGEEIMMKLVAINGAVMAVVSVVSTGSDFAMGNASRVLGNVVKDNLQVAGEMASNREALMALVTVVQGGRDKSRGNASATLGRLCDARIAKNMVEHRVVARHRSIIGELPGCVAALFRCAIDCEPDVQAQASAALASVLRHNKDNLAQLCSLDDAILALMSLAATATHKAAPPANEAIANIADVRDGSVEAGLQLVTTAGVLDMLVEVMMREDNDGEDSIYDHEDNDRRNAAAEAARAFANATEALRVPGEGLLLDDEGAGDEKPFRAKGVPGLRGAILNVREGLTALVQVATEGSDVGKENAMRCLANVGGEDDAMSEKVCWHAGLLDAVIALCSTGTDTAKREGMRTIINVADVELEQCEAFLQGIFALRGKTEEAINPPPVVISALIFQGSNEHPFTEVSAHQKKLVQETLASALSVPIYDVKITKIAAFGKHSVVVHVIFQFTLEESDFASEVSSAIIRAAMSGTLAAALQAKGVRVIRITLAEDPLVTFKNVFAGMEDTMAPELDLGDKRPLTAESASSEKMDYATPGRATPGSPARDGSPGRATTGHSRGKSRSAAAARVGKSADEEEAERDGGVTPTYLHASNDDLRDAADEMVFLEMLSNRDLAQALSDAGGDGERAWRDMCRRALAPGSSEALAVERMRDPPPVVGHTEGREDGVAGMRRVHAQCDEWYAPNVILPRANRIAEAAGCLDVIVRTATGLAPHLLPSPQDPSASNSFYHTPQMAAILVCCLAGRPIRELHPMGVQEGAVKRPDFAEAVDACFDILRYASDRGKEEAALALLNLSISDRRFGVSLTRTRHLATISEGVRWGTLQGRMHCCSLLSSLASLGDHGPGFCDVEGLLDGIVALGQFGEEHEGASAAREVAGLVLSNLAVDPANALKILNTQGAVRMLAACLVGGCTLEGTTAAKALSYLPLSQAPSERGSIAHTRAQWFIESTEATRELLEVKGAGEGLVQILLEGQPQSKIEAASVLAKLTGEMETVQYVCDTPGTFPAIISLLPLSSPQAAEAGSTLVYRISLERPFRSVLGGTGNCIQELTSVLDKSTAVAKAMAGPGLLNLMESPDNQTRLIEATNVLNILLRIGEESLSHIVRRSAVGALRQVVDGVGGFKAMRIKRRVDGLAFK